MELLRSYLSRVRIPEPTNRIYKQECCVSFETPKSKGGLFVDMNSFLAFGKDYVGWNYEKTGNPVYLHIKETIKPVSEDRPSKKPTLLAIGIEGGFDNNEPEYEVSYEIVILPDYVTLPFPSVELPEKVRLAVDAVIMAAGAERKEQISAWTADKKLVSKHAMDLKQLDNGVIVPPSGWKCEKCDKTENLWLNLTDGSILCGRSNWDGSGGNNHAVNHYNVTGYPLAVKLGTITADLEAADVYSYDEDESVVDPLLAQHLLHFGIDFSSLQKTEMTTAERELDQNTNFDWNRIQESGQEVEPLFGPGYTGLVNLGNSCYLAATMQVVFSTRGFYTRYYLNQNLKMAFDNALADPTVDLNMQLAKLAHGLLSGKYSLPATKKDDVGDMTNSTLTAKQEGIPPRMFKSVIAASHPEFSTMRQQDALEFFLHFIDQVERINVGNPNFDPSRSFKFGIEERLQCPSGRVAYNKRHDYILSLSIPLHKATNKKELEEFQKLRAEKDAEGKELSADEIVRPRVLLKDCLDCFSAPEEVHDFYSTALDARTTAVKTAGLTSFPDYLVLHMRKFVMEEGWVPKKLDVYIDVPDTIDISHMRSKGLQPGEELLPEGGDSGVKLVANEDIVTQLLSMGFNYLHCQKAAINTSNAGVEAAMNWLLSHMNDPDIDDPITKEAKSAPQHSDIDPTKVDTLVSFGFEEELARKALLASDGDIEKATEWIFNPPTGTSHMDASQSSSTTVVDAVLPDGDGRYRLIGLVSHIGTSTHCGHYVAHIRKDGRWVIFNDDKVGASKNPPIDMGYLYFFERIDS
ncbi:ubiquitin carboxyl-terminal hydrolase 14 isoform X2 [Olea europaea var. sylvestris]|uniref:ubiquitin carboxyl-terminal hydrolase 14 isoform X2 n=1 Tax=Olea europaea var. sylvestris TaxID=158386 RepID=UPI000C1CDBE8|nr:ubiquitin carboxyl-terminal hydrolase 14 isoform X2 [Olea europaea var. sylvestris]